MHEELYEPLPDVNAYLERIGIERAEAPTLEFLDTLVYAHQLTVPFENLDICEKGAVPSLGIADLFDKIVTRRRGGYCFEMNAAFGALLRALGFEVRPSQARVLLRPIANPIVSHRANIVTIDGQDYLVDVGFGGPMQPFALKLLDGYAQGALGQTFTAHKHGEHWWDIGFTGSTDEEKIVLRACALPSEEHDFVPLSFFQSLNPESVFRTSRRANVRTEDGAHDLYNMTYTHFANGERTVRELETAEELDNLLAETFGIVNWR